VPPRQTESSDDVPSNIRLALEGFVRDALALYASSYDQPLIGWRQLMPTRWERKGTTSFVQAEGPFWMRLPGVVSWNQLEQLSSYGTLIDQLGSDPWIGGQLGKLVGTASGGATTINLQMILDFYLLLRLVGQSGSFDFDPVQFARIADPILAYLAATELPLTQLVPILGLQCQADPIELSEGALLRRLSDEEANVLLTLDVLPTAVQQDARILDEADQWCVAQVTMLEKVIDPPVGPPDLASLPPSIFDAAERLVTALRLEVGGMVMCGPHVTFGSRGPGGDSLGAGMARTSVVRPLFFVPSVLPQAAVPDVMATWRALDRSHVRKAAAMQIALRRLRDAPQRPNPEDLLIDAMIAAEAFFLSGTDDRSQFGFRLGLLAALYVEVPGCKRSDVKRFMSRAYGVRSKVVHGVQLEEKDLRRLDGSTGTVKEVAEDLETLMRLALRRAVHDANGRAMPDWDAMLVSFLDRQAGSEKNVDQIGTT
jgi:Apea-like HEPN